ncbi:FtsQ-type POTRA domain-containing protein [Oscillibacter sp.]|uniref:cell division protein FtsQ/DivIB n=1 Tax=Oscillibacter sp. TaxID=1945593 RepID=UPI002632BB29|nr:FtsQ-type POTRA domain-containing protein [Oscillibacter sp.]MDD3346630.1 FtsQ-type POTRA domain-containing protein [Oscillibacter sp.]
MARRRKSNRRRRGSFGFLYKLLSVLVICGAIVAALTLFFRVDTIVVTGQQRYTQQEVVDATGIQSGDNLFLLNKYNAANNIATALPYINIEDVWIRRKLPDTLLIDVKECGIPMAVVQDGSAWLVSPGGKIVEQKASDATSDYGVIDGCQLLAPSVGTQLALATEHASQQRSLLALMTALEEAGELEKVDAIHLQDLSMLTMEYDGRFTVQLPYGADYERKLKAFAQILTSGAIQDNMTGTFDMRREDGRINLIQNVR